MQPHLIFGLQYSKSSCVMVKQKLKQKYLFMKLNFIILSMAVLSLASCTKGVDTIKNNITANNEIAKGESVAAVASKQFVQYMILSGQQYCDKNAYQAIKLDQLSFVVKFDSSAIYKNTNPANQDDINKLFGFSDNKALHHEYSARFGWRWSNNALRLFGYIYNNSARTSKELGTVNIGAENTCSIKVSGSTYIFTLNGESATMPRESKTVKAEGYKLYPYFGGDEMAPHNISILIKEL